MHRTLLTLLSLYLLLKPTEAVHSSSGADLRCGQQVEEQVKSWHGRFPGGAIRHTRATDRNVFPTGQLGVWLDLRWLDNGAVSLSKITTGSIDTITWNPLCEASRQNYQQEAPSSTNGVVTDRDLRNLAARWRRLAVYVWTPHMPLSVDGLMPFMEAARRANWFPVAIVSPDSDPSYILRVAHERQLPLATTRRAWSNELAFQGAFVHAPSVVLFADGRPVGPAIPGYRQVAAYERLLIDASAHLDRTAKQEPN